MLIESKVVINRPAKTVWDFLNNPDNLKLWIAGFQKVEPISGTPGTIGAKAKHYFKEKGKNIVLDEEITEVIPGKKFASTLSSSMMINTVNSYFSELAIDQTEYTLSSEIEFTGFPWKQVGPLMKGE